MIELRNISFRYGEHNVSEAQLNDISLHIRRGEFLLLTGKSGCGKTTLTRVLNGLCPQFYPGTLSGECFLEGRDVVQTPISELGSIAGSVFQDPRSQFFATNTTDEIALGMEHSGIDRKEIQKRLFETSAQIGVENLLDRPLFSLSSGEKQRIAIASACAMRPKVLVLDEPSANLDSDAIARLSILLSRLKDMGTTIILSEHRLHYVKDFFDRMAVMENGEISRIYSREQALSLDEHEMKNIGLRLFNEPEFQAGKRAGEERRPEVMASQVSLAFEGQTILDNVSFHARKGEVLAVTGGNGAGKSSLCRVLTGLYKPHTGLISLGGIVMKRKRRIQGTFFVQQDADYQLYAATVKAEFYVGKRNHALLEKNISECLDAVGLEDVMYRHPLSLSGGQKQRLLLALSLASGKDILVLDEPTSGLDGCNMRLLAALFRKLADSGKTLILITHDKELICDAADSVLHMEKGKISYHRFIRYPGKKDASDCIGTM